MQDRSLAPPPTLDWLWETPEADLRAFILAAAPPATDGSETPLEHTEISR